METKVRQKRGVPPNVIRICIDTFEHDLKGRVYTKISEQPLRFEHCGELFWKTDALFDRCGFPQTFQEKRSFSLQRNVGHYAFPKTYLSDEEILQQQGNLKTFDVFIQSRRRVGWQGTILGEDGSMQRPFWGEMELLNYISQETLYILENQ